MKERIIISTDYAKSGNTKLLNHDEIKVTFGTEEESIESIEKLLANRPRTFKQIIRETGQTQTQVAKAVAKMVDKGRVIVDNLIEHSDGKIEAQLKLTF